MKKLPQILLIVMLAMLVAYLPTLSASGQSPSASPTPTYDPFAQPPLPDNPTELELGRYLFWRYCMPCHGDKGQGLTDDFRAMWEPDHQNCWARGCHSGRYANDSFPVPTVVPPLVRSDQLSRFADTQDLSAFLKATHPPEAPGSLTDNEYQALAAYLFTLNGRLQEPSVTSTPTSTPPPASPQTKPSNSIIGLLAVVILMLAAVIYAFVRRTRTRS